MGDSLGRYIRRADKDRDREIVRVIHPRNEKMHVANVLATAPDLLHRVCQHQRLRRPDFWPSWTSIGCLDRHPPYVSYCLKAAARFQKVLFQFESDEQTGSKHWLASFEKCGRELSEDRGDLKVVPKIDAGKSRYFSNPLIF